MLAQLDKEYSEQQPNERWENHYAKGLLGHFAP
jgi:hypothetical protein